MYIKTCTRHQHEHINKRSDETCALIKGCSVQLQPTLVSSTRFIDCVSLFCFIFPSHSLHSSAEIFGIKIAGRPGTFVPGLRQWWRLGSKHQSQRLCS